MCYHLVDLPSSLVSSNLFNVFVELLRAVTAGGNVGMGGINLVGCCQFGRYTYLAVETIVSLMPFIHSLHYAGSLWSVHSSRFVVHPHT